MDTVRFGRALGFGARSAAKTLIRAIDAAKAEDPSRRHTEARQATSQPPARPTADPRGRQVQGVREGARRFRDSAVQPVVRLSGVLMLEIAGVFFAIFALYGFNTMWRARSAWHGGTPNHGHFVGGAVMLAVFGYFCLSSFVRARRRERGR